MATNCLDCGIKLRGHGNPQRCRLCARKHTPVRVVPGTTHCSDLRKQRISAGVKKAHAEGRYEGVIEKVKAAADVYWATIGVLQPSKLEICVQQALTELGIRFVSQYRPIGYHRVYDLLLPDHKTLIEVDGWYWHESDFAISRNQPQVDAEKDAWALSHGFVIVRIPEDSLQDTNITVLLHSELLPQLM